MPAYSVMLFATAVECLIQDIRCVLLCVTEEVRKERQKETKNDTAVQLAALLHEVRLGHVGSHYCVMLIIHTCPPAQQTAVSGFCSAVSTC